MKDKEQLVFVYGTLKKGHSNHLCLNGAEFKGYDTLVGPYTMFDLGAFPGVSAIPDADEENRIRGEVYMVDGGEGIDTLDILEGHPTFYTRVMLELESGRFAWVYLLPYQEYMGTCPFVDGLWWYPSDEERQAHEAASA